MAWPILGLVRIFILFWGNFSQFILNSYMHIRPFAAEGMKWGGIPISSSARTSPSTTNITTQGTFHPTLQFILLHSHERVLLGEVQTR